MTALPSPLPDPPGLLAERVAARSAEAPSFATPSAAPLLGLAPDLDMAAAATASFVMSDHQVGWHDIEDAVLVYHWVRRGVSGLPAGLQVHPTAGQAASFLHGHRARQGRDAECEWCISDLRPPRDLVEIDECAVATTRYVFAGHPARAGETLEMILVYLWVVATSRPSYSGDGVRRYDQGEGAIRFLHAWRAEQGLEEPGTCAICP